MDGVLGEAQIGSLVLDSNIVWAAQFEDRVAVCLSVSFFFLQSWHLRYGYRTGRCVRLGSSWLLYWQDTVAAALLGFRALPVYKRGSQRAVSVLTVLHRISGLLGSKACRTSVESGEDVKPRDESPWLAPLEYVPCGYTRLHLADLAVVGQASGLQWISRYLAAHFQAVSSFSP